MPRGRGRPGDPDEYRAVNVFWVPAAARWPHLTANARQPTVGKTVMSAIRAGVRPWPSIF